MSPFVPVCTISLCCQLRVHFVDISFSDEGDEGDDDISFSDEGDDDDYIATMTSAFLMKVMMTKTIKLQR